MVTIAYFMRVLEMFGFRLTLSKLKIFLYILNLYKYNFTQPNSAELLQYFGIRCKRIVHLFEKARLLVPFLYG